MILASILMLPVEPPMLYRVETPAHEDAITSSSTGSVLTYQPDAPWRYEQIPTLDQADAVAQHAISALNTDVWNATRSGGEGVKIAIFDYQWIGAELPQLGLTNAVTHDCWAHESCAPALDTFTPRFSFETGSHGVACAEIIHALAPDAELHLVYVSSYTTFENAVDWAIREGIDIVSMSMSYFNYSFYDGTGDISSTAARLADHGTLMVTSAGNYAQSHWRGLVTDLDNDGTMEFDGENGIWVYMSAGQSGLNITWDEFFLCGQTDFDAIARSEDGDIIGRSDDLQTFYDTQHCEPFERLVVNQSEAGWVYVQLQLSSGSANGVLVDILAPSGTFYTPVADNSIADPGPHPSVVAVGAVNVDNYLTNDAEVFSSRGNPTGLLVKPEISGPDGLDTLTYGAAAFFGTSASAPTVAASLALVLSDDPTLSPREGFEKLKGWAWNSDPSDWHNNDIGNGKVRLPVSDETAGCSTIPPAPTSLLIIFLPLLGIRRFLS